MLSHGPFIRPLVWQQSSEKLYSALRCRSDESRIRLDIIFISYRFIRLFISDPQHSRDWGKSCLNIRSRTPHDVFCSPSTSSYFNVQGICIISKSCAQDFLRSFIHILLRA